MGKGPGLYSNIGAKARNLLNDEYVSGYNFFIPIAAKTSYGIKREDVLHANIRTKLLHNTNSTHCNVYINYKVYNKFTIDDLAPGLKAIFSFYVNPDLRLVQLKLQYLHEYAGIETSVRSTANPIVNFSGVVGTKGLALGTSVSFNTSSGNLTKCNATLGFTRSDLSASLTLEDKGDTLKAAYYHVVDMESNTAVGAELSRTFSSKENKLTVGAHRDVDDLTMIKARLDSRGKVGALIKHEWRPKCVLIVSGEVETRATVRNAKIGLSVALLP